MHVKYTVYLSKNKFINKGCFVSEWSVHLLCLLLPNVVQTTAECGQY